MTEVISMPEHENFYDTQPEDQGFEYDLLTGHERTDNTWKSGEQLRMEYIQLTDTLVHKMTDGFLVKNPETGESETRVPDVVVWLDKSARPLAWLTKDLWPTLAADPKTGEIPKMPAFKFVNIDREQWINVLDPNGSGIVDMSRIDDTVIRGLRSVFVSPKAKENGLTEDIDEAYSELDGKTIMIVDEVYSSGRTLDYATRFFSRAFPTAYIGSAHWMRNIAIKDGAKGNADLPVWYNENISTGRGIGNRNDRLSEESENTTQRLGRFFLSTRLRQHDPSSDQLRVELHELATNPDVPILPSSERSNEDREARYSSYNHGATRQEVIERKNEIRAKSKHRIQ